MNKEKKEDVSQKTDHLTTNIRSYFTKEINEQIAEMSVKTMEMTMRDLVNTQYWIAILKYTGLRMPYLDATLRGTNPHTDPHPISWAQGCMNGLCDLEGYVIELNAPPEQEEENPEQGVVSKPEGVIIGN